MGLSNLFDVYFFKSNNGLIVGQGGTILKTTDGGNNWVLTNQAEQMFI
ncbi:MAG: hypothetical protein IPI19_07430 [Ignavibacteriales bacterium]|nr:hypothetical protein [Ignavibacteriales bacterium]